jgi:ATP-dependent DNA helicase RecQ
VSARQEKRPRTRGQWMLSGKKGAVVEDPQSVLKSYFGYDSFRPNQRRIVYAVLSGRDVLAVMPTGAGKSICYQVPAVCLGGLTLVVSPLISLMRDQVEALGQVGIRAAFVNSSLTPAQRRKVLDAAADGAYTLLYVAPERLESSEFLSFCQAHPPQLMAIDEAHCISQWGQDFRPSYTRISGFLGKLPARPPVAAFTATATERVRGDIRQSLGLRQPLEVLASFDRPNLHFVVHRLEGKGKRGKDRLLKQICRQHEGQSGIIYCTTRKTVEQVCDDLRAWGFSAGRYHGALGDRERAENQEAFINDEIDLMVATNAFGMGIDKSNVGFVVHYNLPLDVESYYQEAGRAGRDGEPADCILLYSPADVRTCDFLINAGYEMRPDIDGPTHQELIAHANERLKMMTFYATTQDCLRGFLLRYFGEQAPGYCGNCSNCETAFTEQDVTVEAQKIISCVARLAQRDRTVGKALIADILHGSKGEKVRAGGYDTLSTYGIMADCSLRHIRFVLDALIEHGLLGQREDPYRVVVFTDRSGRFLRNRETLTLKVPQESDAERTKRKDRRNRALESSADTGLDPVLFQRLKELRARIAAEEGIPAYVVFSNHTLHDMCRLMPETEDDLLDVSGVGRTKAGRYGTRFLAAIDSYRRESHEPADAAEPREES